MSELEKWFHIFIKEFRSQYESLPETTRKFITYLDNFDFPCQIVALWIKEPELQYVLVVKDPNLPDLDIHASDPVSSDRLVDVMESMLKIPWLHTHLNSDDLFYGRTYEEVLENKFLGIARYLKETTFNRPKQKSIPSFAKFMYVGNGFFWTVIGNLAQLNPKQFATELMTKAKNDEQSALTRKPEPPSASTAINQPPVIKGYGTFFYPPFWVGELPSPTFRQRFSGFNVYPGTYFNVSYKGNEVRISVDGYIAIGEQDKIKCMRLLNEIMGSVLLSGIPVLAVRENDVGYASFQIESEHMASMSFPISPFRAKLAERHLHIDEKMLKEYREISKEALLKVIKNTEKVTQSIEGSDYLVFLLEAYTYFANSEYMQSFIMSWLVLERYINKLWTDYLKKENISGKRKDKLTNSNFWTVDDILETLTFAGNINKDKYKLFMILKRKRNKISHSGEVTQRSEAQECFKTAETVVKNELGITQ